MGPGNAEEDPAEGSQLLNEADGLTGGGVVGGVGTRGPAAVFDEPLFPAGMFMAIADGAGGAGGAIDAAIVGELVREHIREHRQAKILKVPSATRMRNAKTSKATAYLTESLIERCK